MGMFDEIEYKGKHYQTKDFDSVMARFKVLGNLLKVLDREKDVWVVVPFHGIVQIYDADNSFFLKFSDGLLVGEIDDCEYLKVIRSMFSC